MDWTERGLRDAGFTGFHRVHTWRDWIAICPSSAGVYVVLCADCQRPSFLASSSGGHFKGRDPTVAIERLEREWIDGIDVLYIGKADLLRRRIEQLLIFSEGEPIGHWGGRFLWQLEGHKDFEIAWITTPDERPVDAEAKLLIKFRDEFGQLPYANIQGPQRQR